MPTGGHEGDHNPDAQLHIPGRFVLANSNADVARLHERYADHQSVAAAKAMDLNRHFQRQHPVGGGLKNASAAANPLQQVRDYSEVIGFS
jgi:hypothetical protein